LVMYLATYLTIAERLPSFMTVLKPYFQTN